MLRFCKQLILSVIVVSSFQFRVVGLAASPVPLHARNGVVASTSELASKVGVEVLKKGGNAIDAAAAVGLALAVTWPSGGNIGGGGFMLVHKGDGNSEVIDYRERAPLAATRDMYLDAQGNIVNELSTVGYKAVAVPGTIAGLALAQKRHGKLTWAQVVEPALKLARDGFVVNYHFAQSLKRVATLLERFPDSKKVFLRGGSRPYEEGEVIKQPELAATFARLKARGPREFYEGQTAKLIVADMKANGGLVSAEDLKQYEPAIRTPLRSKYRGYEFVTMPPPSSGGAVLINILNMLEPHRLSELGFHSADSLHLVFESMKRAFADRAEWMGDTDFVKVPLSGLLNPKYALERAKSIQMDKATPSSEIKFGEPTKYESPETTHYVVADKLGNVVSNTYTLNGSFGAGVMAKGTGVLLNNEMDDFTSKPGSPNMYGLLQNEKNAIAPKKRPLSSMTPTIVLKDGKLFFAVGSPGGPTIINTVLQTSLNIVDFGMNIQEAIDAPRFHHQWMPDVVKWEARGISKETKLELEKRGHVFDKNPGYIGDAQGILYDEKLGMFTAASDPRLGGKPAGY